MMSFSRTFGVFLGICLLTTAGLYYYKHHPRTPAPSPYELSDQRFLIQSAYGFPFLELEKSVEDKGSPDLAFILKSILPKNPTVLHLGARTGLHTILLSKVLENKGKILAFEGHPKLGAILKENMDLHKLKDVVEVFLLISAAQKSTLSICFDATYPTQSDTKISKEYEQTLEGQHCQDISLAPLDSLSLPKVDFILIENNTTVSETLAGASSLLQRSGWPPILIIASPIPESKKELEKQMQRLQKEGYYFYSISSSGLTAFSMRQKKSFGSPPFSKYLLLSKELMPIEIEK